MSLFEVFDEINQRLYSKESLPNPVSSEESLGLAGLRVRRRRDFDERTSGCFDEMTVRCSSPCKRRKNREGKRESQEGRECVMEAIEDEQITTPEEGSDGKERQLVV